MFFGFFVFDFIKFNQIIFLCTITINKKSQVELVVWDLAGVEDYEKLRALSYTDANCILIFYAIDSPQTFDNVVDKWISEVKFHCPRAPIILVGTKMETRESAETRELLKKWNNEPIKRDDAVCVAKLIGNFDHDFLYNFRFGLKRSGFYFGSI